MNTPELLQNLVPEPLLNLLNETEKRKRMLSVDAVTLSTLVSPTDQDRYLRLQFWDEHERAKKASVQMDLMNVLQGVCSWEYVVERSQMRDAYMAWLLTPPINKSIMRRANLEKGIEKMALLLDMPEQRPIVEDGRVIGYEADYEMIKTKLKIVDMLEKREYGDYEKNINTKSMDMNKAFDQMKDSAKLESLDEEIEMLQSGKLLTEIETKIPRKK